jgi:hypothetical protein
MYTLDVDAIDRKLEAARSEKRQLTAEELAAKKEKAAVKYTGFVAQEVPMLPKPRYDFSGVDVPKNKEDFYGIRYAEFVVPLVKAVQEQQQQLDELKAQNRELKELVTKLLNSQPVSSVTNNQMMTITRSFGAKHS